MNDYQAIYDAVRSRMSDVGSAVRDVAERSFDISHAVAMIRQQFEIAGYEMQRPSVLYRPAVGFDGNKWCALYGDGKY